MANLQRLVALREVHSELTETERVQFMHEIANKWITHGFPMNIIFTGCYRSKTPQSDVNQIETMTAIIRTILEARTPAELTDEDRREDTANPSDRNDISNQDQKRIGLNICDLSTAYTGEIASYLSQTEYHRLSLVSRRIYLNIHSPITLRRLHITSETKIAEIPFSTIPLLNHITFQLNAMVNIPINIDDPDLMMEGLLDEEYPIIRQTMNKVLKCIITKSFAIDGTARELRMRRMEHLGEVLVKQLPRARQIAADSSLIDNSNADFPDDLKTYTERMPKLTMYFDTIRELLNLQPTHMIPLLIEDDTWNTICDIVSCLEHGADTHQWAKNRDKVVVLHIIVDIIEKHGVDPDKVFRSTLIDCLTSQYLVSTRGKVISEYASALVSVTYRILLHFASDSPDPMGKNVKGGMGNEHGRKQESDEPVNWLSRRIVDQHWFLWSVSDIVTPHNVYGSPVAAESILSFIEKVIDFKCMQSARTMMLQEACEKWAAQKRTTIHQQLRYARETIFKLLMLILRTKEDHLLFLRINGEKKLLKKWIQNFFFSNNLKNAEELSCYNLALDFFIFHVKAAIDDPEMRDTLFVEVMEYHLRAITALFGYYADENSEEWKQTLSKALELMQLIFDCEKLFDDKFHIPIRAMILKQIVQSQIPALSTSPRYYGLTKDSSPEEKHVICHINKIVKDAKSGDDESMRNSLLSKFSLPLKNVQVYHDKVAPLLELFIANYAESEDWTWDQHGICQYALPIMLNCWFLQIFGVQFSEMISKHISLSLGQLMHREEVFKSTTLCHVIYSLIMSSGVMDTKRFLDPLTMRLFIQLHKGVVASLLDLPEDNNGIKITKYRQLDMFKNWVLLRYLPYRLSLCVDAMNHRLLLDVAKRKQASISSASDHDGIDGKECKNEDDKEFKMNDDFKMLDDFVASDTANSVDAMSSCFGMIQFYFHVLNADENIVSIQIIDNPQGNINFTFPRTMANIARWQGLVDKMKVGNTLINSELSTNGKRNLIETEKQDQKMWEEVRKCFDHISKVIKEKIKDCNLEIESLRAQQNQNVSNEEVAKRATIASTTALSPNTDSE